MEEKVNENTNIAVVGAGYVGMSLAALLAQKNNVTVFDIDQERVEQINLKKATIQDPDLDDFLNKKKLTLFATSNLTKALASANFIIIATPTDFDISTGYFDTQSVEETIESALKVNQNCSIIIKSTIPVGYTEFLREKYNFKEIYFSPEFLRENLALHDNLYPSRIIVGGTTDNAKQFASLLLQASFDPDTPIIFSSSAEAEGIKLFSNTYLAMRVAFFNELDTFAFSRDLDVKNIIEGVSADPRIGNFYNNPSFGYGGYCLPKDTQQLLANYKSIPQNLIQAIVDSNNTRQTFIAESIIKLKPKYVGIYKLSMKLGSDNFRSSSIQGVMKILIDEGFKLVIYEPNLMQDFFMKIPVVKKLEDFKKNVDIILANRLCDELHDVKSKIFSRDVFQND